jgi:signal transduction histidine kinase
VTVSVDGGELAVSVSNLGAPIASQDLEKVFEPYWRPATSQPGGGLGLGLYICSQIVRAHGGTLSVSSSAAMGTCFVARIPAAEGR